MSSLREPAAAVPRHDSLLFAFLLVDIKRRLHACCHRLVASHLLFVHAAALAASLRTSQKGYTARSRTQPVQDTPDQSD